MQFFQSLLIFSVFFFTACEKPIEKPLKIAANDWAGYTIFFETQKQRDISKYVEIHSIPSTTEAKRLLRNGLLDGACFTLDEAIDYYSTNPNIYIVMGFDASNGADVLMANKNINTLQELKGKKVGYESTALGALMLAKVLEKAQLKIEDIDPISIELNQHEEAYNNNLVDSIITFEPIKSNLLKSGAHVLFDSSMIPDTIIDVLVINKELVDAKDKRLVALLRAYFETFNSTNLNDKTYEGIHMFSLEDNKQLFINKEIIQKIENVYNVMIQNKLVENDLNLDNIYSNKMIGIINAK